MRVLRCTHDGTQDLGETDFILARAFDGDVGLYDKWKWSGFIKGRIEFNHQEILGVWRMCANGKEVMIYG